MSVRDVITQDRALRSTLEKQRREVSGLERRTAWKSSVQQKLTSHGSFSVPIGDPGLGAGWELAVATLASTLALDPGRWILTGEAVHEIFCSPRTQVRRLGAIMRWESGELFESATAMAGEGEPSLAAAWNPTVTAHSQVTESVTSDLPISVKLFVFVGITAGYSSPDYDLKTSSILAFPC